MKRIICLFLILVMVAGMMPVEAQAETEISSGTCGESLTWVLTDDGTLTISGQGAMTDYSCDAPWYDLRSTLFSVVIEEGVTSIGNYAFWGCNALESVFIPNSVENIGDSSFSSCESLEEITIPDSVKTLGSYAFAYCSKLKKLFIPKSVSAIGSRVYYACTSLRTAGPIGSDCNIEFGWETEIPAKAFHYAYELTDIVLPSSITTIGASAFFHCWELKNIVLPDGLTFIGSSAFAECATLEHIEIPAGVTTIGSSAFEGCSLLTSAGPVGSGSNIEFGWSDAIPDFAFCYADYLTSINLPEELTEIGWHAFTNCGYFNDTNNWTDTVLYIGAWLIDGTDKPTDSTMGNGYTTGECIIKDETIGIADSAFRGCYGMTSVTFPNSVKYIGNDTFYGCSGLRGMTLPADLEKIGDHSLYECRGLTSVLIPDGTYSIGSGAFTGCSNLTQITIPASVTFIGGYPFSYCGNLSDIYFAGSQKDWETLTGEKYDEDRSSYTVHFSYKESEGDSGVGYVSYFQKWDAENQIAYFDSDPSENPANLGSQVTEETNTSFLENVDELVGTYVLVETKSRDDGMLLPDTLISIRPVETKSGTVTANDGLTISIDGVEYAITERLGLVLYDAGDMVTYHLYNGELVGLRDYDPDTVNPEPPDEPEAPEDEYRMVVYPNGELIIEVGETLDLTCVLYNDDTQMAVWEQPQLSISHLEDNAPVSYEGWEKNQAGGYVLTVKGISPGTAYLSIYDTVTEVVVDITIEVIPRQADSIRNLTFNYWDDLENMEKTAQTNWGYPLFYEDARNIENSAPASFAELVKISALLSNASYDLSDGGYLQQTLNQLGAENIEVMNSGALDISYPAHSISHVEFGEEQNIIIVTIRGSKTLGDWITDFRAFAGDIWNSPKEHPGFSMAKNRIFNEVKAYLSKYGIVASDSKILITGHSYGGAVANLLANSMSDVFDRSDIYAYTFASPNNIVVSPSFIFEAGKHNNIHNFRNAWDPVARLPVALLPIEKYTVFGQQHFFTLEEVGDDSEGIDLFGNHNCTHYVNCAFNLVEQNSVDSLKTRCVQVRCPVDVTAYDENGNVIGKITDNQLDQSSTSIMMYPVYDQKNIFIDQNEDVQLSIVATDIGTMDIIITEYDVVTGNVSAIKEYSSVGLFEGKDFYTSVSDEIVTAGIGLEVVDNEGNRLAIVNEDGTETLEISEKHKHSSEIKNDKEATCIESGYTGDEVCAECGTVLKQGEEIPFTGHEFVNGICSNCGITNNPFIDVQEDSFYYDPVMWAVENGITNGATETTFNPNGNCLRAHVVTFLHRAGGNPAPNATRNPFTDVKPGDFFYMPVLWAVENSITNGTSASTFGSYTNCNRAAVVTFLWRAAGSPEPTSANNPFVDVASTAFYHKAVLWAVENGITNGVDATHFGPTLDCNRAQVVTFLYRSFKINNEKPTEPEADDNEQIVKVASGIDFYAILKSNGKVDVVSWNDMLESDCCADWSDIVDIDANNYFVLGLRENGSVVFKGVNVSSRGDVGDWSDIKQVSAGGFFSAGLKTNGTVVAVGSNDDGECNVSDWTGIIAISTGFSHTVGLKADGTVVATGSNHMGQCDVATWSDIIAIAVGDGITVGLKADGTVVTTSVYYNNPAWTDIREAQNWTDITAIDAGGQHIVALKSDGTVVTAGFVSEETSTWIDVTAISAGDHHTVGLLGDGTIIVVNQPKGT